MPNFQIPSDIKNRIERQAIKLIDRTEEYVMSQFTLSVEQVQHAILPPETVATMRALQMSDIYIPSYNHTNIYLHRPLVPGVEREAVVHVQVIKDRWFLPMQTHWSWNNASRPPDRGEAHMLNTALLSEEEVAALAKWTNDAVRAHRLARIAKKVVEVVLGTTLPTTAHMRAIWPFLATLCDDRDWRQKFETPTRGMARYEP